MKINLNNLYRYLIFAGLSITIAFATACSSGKTFAKLEPLPDDRQNIPEPKVRDYNYISDGFDKQFSHQVEQALDLSRQFRHLFGIPKQAYNTDAFGEVPNSSWFTNRNAIKRMSLEEIARGPDSSNGPDTSGYWVIKRAKAEGVTPGFHIKDPSGVRYVIKFDPIGFSELVTGAEVISTKLFYAAGYHTPENYVVNFDPAILKVGDEVKITDKHGKKRFMTEDDLRELLDSIEKEPDGRIRALASKYIPGIPKGPFAYEGTRHDDPNDFIPHQHRRELRGLRVIAAWLNHTDTKSGNSFDSYVTENGKSYIRHYLIDFGSTLGSAAHGPHAVYTGHENEIDPHALLKNTATLGLYVRPYEKLPEYTLPSVGLYDSKLFSPGDFKFNAPNPAFENCTNLDGFWAAKIVMSFTDAQLAEVVKQGQYSDPEAEKQVLDALIARRDKTGEYWFGKVNPLDKFEIAFDSQHGYGLKFEDLAVNHEFEKPDETIYAFKSPVDSDNSLVSGQLSGTETLFIPLPFLNGHSDSDGITPMFVIELRTSRDGGDKFGKSVLVYIGANLSQREYTILQIKRQE